MENVWEYFSTKLLVDRENDNERNKDKFYWKNSPAGGHGFDNLRREY